MSDGPKIADRFVLTSKKIGKGAFGNIYLGTDQLTNRRVAIKLENTAAKCPQIKDEGKFYKILKGGVGIPKVHWCGTQGRYNILVIDLLGPSLEELFNRCSRKFSPQTIVMIGDQMLRRVEYLHLKSLIHRDIKPDNFLIGTGRKENLIYIIDLGLARSFVEQDSGHHIPYFDGKKSITGTARYASLFTHLGVEQSRRDDLESICFSLIYFFKGSLPWQGLIGTNSSDKFQAITERKKHIKTEELCEGCPLELSIFMNYVRSLRFADKPDYGYLRGLLKRILLKEYRVYDCIYDWSPQVLQVQMVKAQQKNQNVIEEELLPIQRSNSDPHPEAQFTPRGNIIRKGSEHEKEEKKEKRFLFIKGKKKKKKSKSSKKSQ